MEASSQSFVLPLAQSTSQESKDPFHSAVLTFSQVSHEEQILREPSNERSTGRRSSSTEAYEDDEKEEEYDDPEAKRVQRTLKRQFGEATAKPRRVLSLLDHWREIQKTLAKTATARSKAMGRKGPKASPKTSPKAGPVVEDAGKGDGLVDGDDQVGDIREKMIKDMQEEIRLEQYNQAQTMRLETQQLEKYETQLTKTRAVLDRHWSAYAEDALSRRLQENWDRYMACDGLPDPGSLPDLNTFLFVWTMENEGVTMDTITGICDVITDLMAKLRKIVRFSDDCSRQYGDEYESIARELRGKLQWWIDLACYRLLRNIEANMTREDMKTSRYMRESNQMVCCVWAPIALPVAAKRITDKERKPIEVAFDKIKLTIKLPADVDCHRMAIRGLWLAYDHYSVETASRRMPDLPVELREPWDRPPDLLEFARREYREKLRIWEEQAEERQLRLEEKKTILENMENPRVLPSARKKGKRGKKQKRPKSAKNNASEFEETLERFMPSDKELLPYLPTPNEIIRQWEEESRKEVRKISFSRCAKHEVNLRKYAVLGGVFRVDLIHQPPQPKDLGKDTSLTTLELPKEPRFARFSRRYEPPQPAPDSERTPEVIEAEMKALETAMESLLLITVQSVSSSCQSSCWKINSFTHRPQVTEHGILVRAAVGGTLDTREKDLVHQRRARHQVQRGETNHRVQKRNIGRPRTGRVQVLQSTVSELGIEAGNEEERPGLQRGCSERDRCHRTSRVRGQRGSSVPQLVGGRLVDAFGTHSRRVRRAGDPRRADAANRLRPVSGTGRGQLLEGSANKASDRGETSARLHGPVVHQLRVRLVPLERDQDLLGDRDAI